MPAKKFKSRLLRQTFSLGILFSFFVSTHSLLVSPSAVWAVDEELKTKTVSAQAFIESQAGAQFKAGDYQAAIESIHRMLDQHPGDPLLLRYKAIALDRLGRSEEAIPIFKELLVDNPSHLPTHYFLGQSYARNGQISAAEEEWQWVIERGEGTPYREWAANSLEQVKAERAVPQPEREKKWFLQFEYGYEYDSNVTLRPDDDTLATSRDQNAGRQSLDFYLRHRPYSRRDLAVDLFYTMRQTLHDDSLNEFNFHSEEFGAQVRKRIQVGDQDVIAGLRYDFLLGFLDDNLFSTRNRWYLSLDTRFTPQTRTVVYDRITLADFGPDGFSPAVTSRDGIYNDVGFFQYFYSSDFTRFVYLNQEFNSAHTRGTNFDVVGSTTRIGGRMPVLEKLLLDVSTGLELGFYHNFSSISTADSSRRRNIIWDIYSALTYSFTENVHVRGFYRYVNAYNQNNFFDYQRHIGGAELVFSQSF